MNSYLLYCVASILVGSLPTGEIIARLHGKTLFCPGNRQAVSIGETFRLLGRPWAIVGSTVDFVKGVVVVWPLPALFFPELPFYPWWLVSLGGALAIVSHCNSLWLGFCGGRGLSTSFGVLAVIFPLPTLGALLVWGCLSFWGLSTRPGALSAAGAMPLLAIIWVLLVDSTPVYFLYLVAFISLWTLWEQRTSLRGYLGIPVTAVPPASPRQSDPEPVVEPVHAQQHADDRALTAETTSATTATAQSTPSGPSATSASSASSASPATSAPSASSANSVSSESSAPPATSKSQ